MEEPTIIQRVKGTLVLAPTGAFKLIDGYILPKLVL